MTEAQASGGRRSALRAALIVLVIVAVGVGSWVLASSNSEGEDIFLERADATGPDPFTTAAIVPTPTPAATTSSALFGGSGNQRVCDPARLTAFLESNPDKAKAWVDALNSDPTLTWSGGNKIDEAQIRAYIAELTPTFLAVDTRVTNHGFKNGEPTPRQSLLQKGTAVLADKEGVPRVRCACGNPLLPPKKVDNPNFTGEDWPGWDDGPPCVGKRCLDLPSTTTTEPTATTTTSTTPPTRKTTTTRRVPPTQPGATTTTLLPTTTTSVRITTTTSPNNTTTTRCSPNDPQC